MARVLEINDIAQLAKYRTAWTSLLAKTPAASFFQSLEWLEIFWRYFGNEQRLRTLLVFDDAPQNNSPGNSHGNSLDAPLLGISLLGIVPLVVVTESTKVGPIRTLTYPLHNWGSFYGPIGSMPKRVLTSALNHIRQTPRDWDILELRWQGANDTNPGDTQQAMWDAGFHALQTVWDRTAIVDCSESWESYWGSRKKSWLERYRSSERKIAKQGQISFVRHRPLGQASNDDSPRWDLYDACEEIARKSWQNAATDGTTLSHESIRAFLRDVHAVAASAGAVDMNLLLLNDKPTAFLYNYYYRNTVQGLRRGYDAEQSRAGVGNILMAYSLRDSFERGDHVYDMGVGALASKRHFLTRLAPIFRFSHFPPFAFRSQLLHAKRWWQSWQQRSPTFIEAGRVQDGTTGSR
jgi:hypothetical protein